MTRLPRSSPPKSGSTSLWSSHGNQHLYLDGQVFGYTVERNESEKHFAALETHHERATLIGTHRIAHHHPSGNGARASDFESWFYLAE